MKKKQTVISKNYLEQTPLRHPQIEWTKDDKGIVTLEIENTGLFNKIAQKVFKRPRISYIHLDELDTVDGKTSYKYYYDEESDAVVVVVSEETGIISSVRNGKIKRGLDAEIIKKILLATKKRKRSDKKRLERKKVIWKGRSKNE